MQIGKEKRALALVASTPRANGAAAGTPPAAPIDKAGAYYRRIEAYARKIRGSDDIETIIRILDQALRETSALHGDDGARLAREAVARAERRIEALKQEMEQLRGLVHVDHLTGALNRSGLEQAFVREAASADRHNTVLGVALLDIDDFKILNDRHGHPAGDAALVHLARTMKNLLRPSDALVRFGGEEFLALFPCSGLEQTQRALLRLGEELARRLFVHDNKELPLTFSAGVTVRRPGEAQSAVIARADSALYEAKRAGKDRVVAFE